MQNRLIDLPAGLSEMHKLQIFKCIGNPLRKPLRDILEETENDATPSGMTDNEKEVAATTKLKRFLMKTRPQTSTPEPEIVAYTRFVHITVLGWIQANSVSTQRWFF